MAGARFLACLLAACGGAGDAPDAGAPDAGNLHVLATLDGVPHAGIPVLLHDADGAVLARGETGATGLVDFTAPAFPALVTAADPPRNRLLTVAGIARDETISFPFLSDPTTSKAHSVQIVPPGPFAGADLYILHWGLCDVWEPVSNPSLAVTVAIAAACEAPDGTLSAVAYAYTGATLSAFAAGTGPSSGDLALGAWRTDWAQLAGTPGGFGGVQAFLPGGSFRFEGFATEPLRVAPIGSIGYLSWVSHPSGPTGQVDLYWSAAPLPGSLDLPDEVFLRPGDTPLAVDYKRRPIIDWAASPDLAGADAVRVWLVWSTAGVRVEWAATLPPDALSVQFPDLPDDLAALRYPGGPPLSLVQGYVDVDTVAGWDSWRSTFGADMILAPPPAAWQYRVGTQRP